MTIKMTRTGVLAMLVWTTILSLPPTARAGDPGAENHVRDAANAALSALNDEATEAGGGGDAFRGIISEMADVPRIAAFVLGRYGPRIRTDAALRSRWVEVFEQHMIAIYRDRLERYAGSELRVVGSVERVAGQDVIVRTEMRSPVSGRMLVLQWRVVRAGAGWKVIDISFFSDGAEIWLAQQQQREFAMTLDRNGGDIDALIGRLHVTNARLLHNGAVRAPE